LSECSFAFVVDGEDGQSFSRPDLNGLPTRTIKRAKLLDVSVVANPAYGNGATQVDARARVTADDQAAIKRQIVAWNARKKENLTRARAVMAEYPELDAETISRGRRLGYSEDTMLSLRFAAITKNMRNEPAQSADPTASLRDDDDFGWDDDDWDADKHERAQNYHMACARKAPNVHTAEGHLRAAARHKYAAENPTETLASVRARDTSRILRS
jgi:hypothetical protein